MNKKVKDFIDNINKLKKLSMDIENDSKKYNDMYKDTIDKYEYKYGYKKSLRDYLNPGYAGTQIYYCVNSVIDLFDLGKENFSK